MFHKKISVGESEHGRGLFADEDIKKGKTVLTFKGPPITWEEAEKQGLEDHILPVGIDEYINLGEPLSLINHSCAANTGFLNNNAVTLCALKDISKGEELTFDYSIVTIDDWTMECGCGSAMCRKTISNFSALSEDIKKQLMPYTPQWVLDAEK